MVDVCVPNIGPRGRARRLRYGVVWGALAIAAAALLVGSDVPRGVRLLLFAPFWIAGTGVFQALEKT